MVGPSGKYLDPMTVAADHSRGARAFIERALHWWFAELRATYHDLARAASIGIRNDPVLEAGERYWVLRHRQRPLGQIDRTVADADDTTRELRRILAAGQRQLTVEIPPERALIKRIRLPAMAQSEIGRVLRFEIGRHFPFPAERVYFRHRVVDAGSAAHGTIEVELVAVPREIVADILRTLRAADMHVKAVAVAGVGGTAPTLLPVASTGRRPLARGERALSMLLAVLVVAALASPVLRDRTRLAAIERETDALEPRVKALLDARDRQQRAAEQVAGPLRLKSSRPPLVALLDDLTKAVPDGAWLQSLTLSGRELVIDGLSPSAATLALALEKSRSFAKVGFRAPITRDPATGLEHFQLSAAITETAP